VFSGFDFDHDEDLRNLLVGQARHPDSPFELADWSVREPFSGDWEAKVRRRIRQVDQVLVMCGEYTHMAYGVAVELRIARDEGKPYFLLWGRSGRQCGKPSTAWSTDQMYEWTWENLKRLIGGER
jgi:hypothetical protein